jgi:hypothetical protein
MATVAAHLSGLLFDEEAAHTADWSSPAADSSRALSAGPLPTLTQLQLQEVVDAIRSHRKERWAQGAARFAEARGKVGTFRASPRVTHGVTPVRNRPNSRLPDVMLRQRGLTTRGSGMSNEHVPGPQR